jgi:glycosyltransferase involved in cell wall biosynthesis
VPTEQLISVVIPTRETRAATSECLALLVPQVDAHSEILVVCGADDGTAAMVERNYPGCRVLSCPPGTGFGELRARGLSESTGDLVVFLEVYCRVGPGWLARWRDQPWEQYAAVGGLVDPAPRHNLANWAGFFSEYAGYLPRHPGGKTDHLLGNNVAFRRDALERAGLIGTCQFWKTFAVWALQARAEACWTDPRQLVVHQRTIAPYEFTRHRYWHGRCFAATRARRHRLAVRLARMATCALVPFLLTARLIRDMRPYPTYRRLFWSGLPFAFVYHAAWAVGELDGYLRGAGPACSRLV